MNNSKPYFKGQKPHTCGHYYPDVLRNYDNLSKSGKMIERNIYCLKCKKKFVKRYRLSTFHNPEKLLAEKIRSIKWLREFRENALKDKKWGKYSLNAEDVNGCGKMFEEGKYYCTGEPGFTCPKCFNNNEEASK